MTNYMSSPIFWWEIDRYYTPGYKAVSPTIFIRGLKWQCTFSRFMEAGTEMVNLSLECLSSSPSSGEFRVESGVVNYTGYYIEDSKSIATYNLIHKKWSIWSGTSQKISSYGSNVAFLVIVIPLGSLTSLLKYQESGEETKYMSPCAVSLIDDFGKLFNNEEHSDFTLTCGESKFYVHKAVLAARSGYFAAMFRNDMTETSEGTCNIENIEPDILEFVLRYMYTGESPELCKNSFQKLYSAADRLLVEPLAFKCRSLCVDYFTNEVNKGNKKIKLIKETQNEQSASVEQSETVKKELLDTEGRQILRNLFSSCEWKLFEQKFPDRAHDVYKPFLEKL